MENSTDIFTPLELTKIISAKQTIKTKMEYLKKILGSICYNNMYLTGGAIASLIQGHAPEDWDVYFTDENTQLNVVAIFIDKYEDAIKTIDEKYREVVHKDKCITENAITLNNGIQLITKHNGTPEDVRATFDFVHCKPYYHFGKDQLFISREQYDLCFNKKLKINNMKAQTVWRQQKFENRGYTWP